MVGAHRGGPEESEQASRPQPAAGEVCPAGGVHSSRGRLADAGSLHSGSIAGRPVACPGFGASANDAAAHWQGTLLRAAEEVAGPLHRSDEEAVTKAGK